MSVEIIPPSPGTVSLELPWDEAEKLTRILGFVRSGDMDNMPVLYTFYSEMTRRVPLNDRRKGRFNFRAEVANDIIRIREVER